MVWSIYMVQDSALLFEKVPVRSKWSNCVLLLLFCAITIVILICRKVCWIMAIFQRSLVFLQMVHPKTIYVATWGGTRLLIWVNNTINFVHRENAFVRRPLIRFFSIPKKVSWYHVKKPQSNMVQNVIFNCHVYYCRPAKTLRLN